MGYLLKDSSPDQLFQAVRNVADGNLSLPQNLALKLMQELQELQRPPQPEPPEAILTGVELTIR